MMKVLVLLGIAIATCAFAPANIVPLKAPKHYEQVFRDAVACSGTYRPYEKIEWQVAPGKSFSCAKNKQGGDIGCWTPPNTITIAGDWVNIDWVVRHEIVHYLLQKGHWPGDTAVFGTKCKATWGYLGDDPNYRP